MPDKVMSTEQRLNWLIANMPQRQRVNGHNQGITSTTPVAVTDLSWPVKAGWTCQLRGLIILTSGGTGAARWQIDGPAVSEVDLWCRWKQSNTSTLTSGQTDNTNQIGGTTSAAGYNSTGTLIAPATVSNGAVLSAELDCTFTFTADGTLSVLAAENVSGQSWTVNYGYLELSLDF
jgi:hypothetical protein